MEKVVVMMATYNGKKYIEKQLDSILSQIGVCVALQVYDDASTDGTQEILQEYEKLYCNMTCTFAKENKGYKNSFWHLLKNAQQAEYYAWADQDDIWNKNKLQSAVHKMKTNVCACCGVVGGGQLWCSNQEIINEEDKSIKEICLNPSHFIEPLNKMYFLCLCEIPGCTQVFDYKLKSILYETAEYANEHNYSHDAWTNVIAAFCGTVLFDSNAYTLHRSHTYSVTNSVQKGLQKYKHMIKLIWRSLNGKQYINYGRGAFELLQDHMKDKKDILIVENFARYKQDWSAKRNLLLDKRMRQRNIFSTSLLKTCILLSKF